uniref:Uncharacterized protein n=1 Tax=Panagrolaimus davidi TaxID=227884 RepID=A0A914PE90_9BILA
MMMVGDAEVPVIHENVQLQNNRILTSLNHLKSNEALLLRRRAAEIFSNSVAFASDIDGYLQKKIVEGIYKIMKKYDEDLMVFSNILTLLKDLAEKRSVLIHLLLPMNITKLLAYHARNSSYHGIRDLCVQILGDFASCCFECQKSVAKTATSVTILEVLEKHLDTLTFDQRIIYSRTLKNIFQCQTGADSETFVISVGSKGQMVDVIKKLITLPSPNEAIFNGLTVLHEWMNIGGIDICNTVANDDVLMTRLLQIFDNDEDNDEIIRIVGFLAFSHDLIAKKIYDFGFFDIIETKLINANGTPNEQSMLWCLSNILGMREFPIANEIIKREKLWEKLVQHCYSYDTHIRREAIFCILNVASYIKGHAKDEMYREFFGRLLIDTVEGFTIESDLSMVRVLGAVLFHIKGDLKQHCHQYRDLISEFQLDKAVEKRSLWIQNALKTFDLTENGRKEMHKLFNLCYDTMFLIQEFKRLQKPPTVRFHPVVSSSVPAKVESPSINLNSSSTFNGSLHTTANVGIFGINQPLRFYPVVSSVPAKTESSSMNLTSSSTFNGSLNTMAHVGTFGNNQPLRFYPVVSSSVPAEVGSSINLNSSSTFYGSLHTAANVGFFGNNQPLPIPPAVRFYPVVFPAKIESPSML